MQLVAARAPYISAEESTRSNLVQRLFGLRLRFRAGGRVPNRDDKPRLIGERQWLFRTQPCVLHGDIDFSRKVHESLLVDRFLQRQHAQRRDVIRIAFQPAVLRVDPASVAVLQ